MFDAFRVANGLRKGGFREPQASAVVSALSIISQGMVTRIDPKTALESLATKADMAALGSRPTWRMTVISGFSAGAIGLPMKLRESGGI